MIRIPEDPVLVFPEEGDKGVSLCFLWSRNEYPTILWTRCSGMFLVRSCSKSYTFKPSQQFPDEQLALSAGATSSSRWMLGERLSSRPPQFVSSCANGRGN